MWNPFLVEMMERLSPLYDHLSQQMKHDPEILALEALVQRHQPCPIAFFAAVNALLLRDRQHPLATYYPYLTDVSQPARDAYPAFRHFCLMHQQELKAILPHFRLQTNEITRCANWLPALDMVFRWFGKKPLSLVELGCSAGLNLLADHYSYRYRIAERPGNEACIGRSSVEIACTLTGGLIPPLPTKMPAIAQRFGIDLFPIDIAVPAHVRTLLGAIWPEERGRYLILKEAIAQAQQLPAVSILQGDAATCLPDIIEQIPQEQTTCILHSYALRQEDPSVLSRVENVLKEASKERTLSRISLEIEQHVWEKPRLELFIYRGGDLFFHQWLATCEVHGDAMCWRVPLEQLG
jgi:hypothetical protein